MTVRNVTPVERLKELAQLMREGGVKKLRLMDEGIDLEMGVVAAIYDEAVLPHVRGTPPDTEEDILFHSAGGTPEMPEVPAGLLETDQ